MISARRRQDRNRGSDPIETSRDAAPEAAGERPSRLLVPAVRLVAFGTLIAAVAASAEAADPAAPPAAPPGGSEQAGAPPSGTAPAAAAKGAQAKSEPAAEEKAVSRRVTLEFSVEGGSQEIEDALRAASALAPLTETDVTDPDRILRAAVAEQGRLTAALYGFGYYQAIVQVTVGGVATGEPGLREAIQTAFAAGNVPAAVRVRVGPVFHFGKVVVHGPGGGGTVVGVGDTGLVPGAVARAGEVRAADGRLLDAMRGLGYPLARVVDRTTIADHATDLLDVTFNVDPGARARFGRIEVRGNTDVNQDFILSRAPFRQGARYHPQPLADYARDLRDLGAFDSVRVVPGSAVLPDGTIPIIVEVSERKARFVGAAAQWSTTEGALISGWWGHRNLFGNAETIRIQADVSRLFLNAPDDLTYNIGFTFTKPGIFERRDSLVITNYFVRETPDAYTRTGWDGEVAIVRKISDEEQYTLGVTPTVSTIEDYFGKHDYQYAGILGEARFDKTDSRLEPRQGYRLTFGLEPAFGEIGASSAMVVATAVGSAYVPLDKDRNYVLAGQLQFGAAFGPSLEDFPANERFYAGGGGSIRGYAYQSVSPRTKDGDIVGGLSLLVASFEMRARVTEQIGVVPFVDVGSAFDASWPDFDPPVKVGAGLGLRYYTPIGPIRADVAVPLQAESGDAALAVYVGLGESF